MCDNHDTCDIENHPYVKHLEAKIADANKLLEKLIRQRNAITNDDLKSLHVVLNSGKAIEK